MMPEEVQSTNQQTPPKEAPKNTSHKINWIHILIGVVLGAGLLGAGFGVYLLTQSKEEPPATPTKVSTPSAKQASPSATATPSADKDETADWKTYSSQKLGISLKYPTEWDFINENLDYDTPNTTLGEKTETDMRIFITKGGPNEGQFKEWGKKQINKFEPDSYGGSSVRLSDISVGGYNGVVVKTETADSLSNSYSTKFSLIVYVKNNNDYYRISYGVPFGSNAEKEYQSRKKTFDLILSTFKFLD